MLELTNVSVVYDPHTLFKKEALHDVSLKIDCGERVAIVGRIGSGKSTLIELFNGLLSPTTGGVTVDEFNITKVRVPRKEIVKKVGVVFQHPESQFFAETVFEEVAYGPKNLGLNEDVVKESVLKAMLDVGLDESYLEKSPFGLSGGEKRRVSIASIIAMNPTYLILDEPTSGLDYAGKMSIMNYIEKIHEDRTVIFVTHNMDEAFALSKRIITLKEGRVIFDGATDVFFGDTKLVKDAGLDMPFPVTACSLLKNIYPDFPFLHTIDEIVTEIKKRKLLNG